MASLDAFQKVRSAFTQVEIPGEESGLSFALHTVRLAKNTRNEVAKLIIAGNEEQPLGRFAQLLLSGKLGPRTQHILFHILFVQESFKSDLMKLCAEIMTIFEDSDTTAHIEENPMIYFGLFSVEDARQDPSLSTILKALQEYSHE